MDPILALAEAAKRGDTAALYALLRQNPYLLEDIDKIPFVDTPLHTAASVGCIHFAIEILGLKPSFAKKLNPDGCSPIDLALDNGHTQTVKELIRHNPELIRVKSKEGFTPLHYVAEMDDVDLLAEFLFECPKSIEDLTVRRESAVHIAVRNRNMRAFKALLGWLFAADLEYILNWQDDKGNTVLHIATFTNNLEVVNLILKKRRINRYKKNVEGLTAIDMAKRLPNAKDNGSIAKRLGGAVTKRFSASEKNLADRFILISEASFLRQYWIRLLRTLNKGWSGNNAMSAEIRQILLVVLVLIATATYQAILTPPSALTQKKNEANSFKSFFHKSNLSSPFPFLLFNTLTFLTSIFSMGFLFKRDGWGFLVAMSLFYLVLCYAVVMLSSFRSHGKVVLAIIPGYFCYALIVSLIGMTEVEKFRTRG